MKPGKKACATWLTIYGAHPADLAIEPLFFVKFPLIE